MNIPVHQEFPLSVDLLLFIGIYNLHELQHLMMHIYAMLQKSSFTKPQIRNITSHCYLVISRKPKKKQIFQFTINFQRTKALQPKLNMMQIKQGQKIVVILQPADSCDQLKTNKIPHFFRLCLTHGRL